jgi:hypothetical protein
LEECYEREKYILHHFPSCTAIYGTYTVIYI